MLIEKKKKKTRANWNIRQRRKMFPYL